MPDLSPRIQAAGGFLAAALALAFATLFIMVDMLRPVLEGSGQDALRPIAEALYPFPAVTEVRIAYCMLALLPILLPLFLKGKAGAATTLGLGVLITLVNLQDAVGGYLLGDRPMLGVLFAASILLPSLVGIAGAWRWWRSAWRVP